MHLRVPVKSDKMCAFKRCWLGGIRLESLALFAASGAGDGAARLGVRGQ
jgi:hypothetical protein